MSSQPEGTRPADDLDPPELDRPEFFADALSAAFLDAPYPVLDRYRRPDGPVRIMDGLWLALRHVDAVTVLRSPACSSDERHASASAGTGVAVELDLKVESLLVFLDPPDHTRLRRLVVAAFTPSVVERLRPRVEAFVQQALDRFDAAAARSPDGSADLVAELAYPLPVQVICELLGVPATDESRLRGWSTAMARALDPSPLRTPEMNEAIAHAATEFVAYLDGLLVVRRAAPDDGLISALLAAESDGERLTRDELLHLVFLLLVAGHETTVGLITNAVAALSAKPDQWAWLVDDPSRVDAAIDELLRYDSPVQMAQRTALAPLRLGDVDVAPGEQVLVLLGGANRDPSFVADPHRLDLTRTPRNHVAFGGGLHHCLGAALARMEAAAALQGLARRFPGLHVMTPGRRRPGFVLRGFEELRVRW